VAEEFLNGADVVAILEQVGREGMAEGVTGGPIRDAAAPDGIASGGLNGGFVQVVFVQVVAVALAGAGTARQPPAPRAISRLHRLAAWRRSMYVREAGKTHCQGQSRPAPGDFRPMARGSSIRPASVVITRIESDGTTGVANDSTGTNGSGCKQEDSLNEKPHRRDLRCAVDG